MCGCPWLAQPWIIFQPTPHCPMQAMELLSACRDAGVNFFDNAEVCAFAPRQPVVPAALLLRRQRPPTPPQHPFIPCVNKHTPLAYCGPQVYAKGQAEEIMGKAFKVTRWLPACTAAAPAGVASIAFYQSVYTRNATECTLAPSQPQQWHAPVVPPMQLYPSSSHPQPVSDCLLQELGWKREDIVVSTKVFWGGDGPNDKGLSRKHIIEGTRNCLKRLQLDYV